MDCLALRKTGKGGFGQGSVHPLRPPPATAAHSGWRAASRAQTRPLPCLAAPTRRRQDHGRHPRQRAPAAGGHVHEGHGLCGADRPAHGAPSPLFCGCFLNIAACAFLGYVEQMDLRIACATPIHCLVAPCCCCASLAPQLVLRVLCLSCFLLLRWRWVYRGGAGPCRSVLLTWAGGPLPPGSRLQYSMRRLAALACAWGGALPVFLPSVRPPTNQ